MDRVDLVDLEDVETLLLRHKNRRNLKKREIGLVTQNRRIQDICLLTEPATYIYQTPKSLRMPLNRISVSLLPYFYLRDKTTVSGETSSTKETAMGRELQLSGNSLTPMDFTQGSQQIQTPTRVLANLDSSHLTTGSKWLSLRKTRPTRCTTTMSRIPVLISSAIL